MKIGELAKRSGLTASRIRFYEANGLMPSVTRQANGYRDYDEDAVWILEIITGAQAAGFTLDEIRPLLPLNSDSWSHDKLLTGLKRKIAEIEALQQRLAYSKAQLQSAIQTIEQNPQGESCADRTQSVLERLRAGGVADMVR